MLRCPKEGWGVSIHKQKETATTKKMSSGFLQIRDELNFFSHHKVSWWWYKQGTFPATKRNISPSQFSAVTADGTGFVVIIEVKYCFRCFNHLQTLSHPQRPMKAQAISRCTLVMQQLVLYYHKSALPP